MKAVQEAVLKERAILEIMARVGVPYFETLNPAVETRPKPKPRNIS